MNEKEELHKLLQKLRKANQVIIVEGIKDQRALVNLGFVEKRIVRLTKPLFSVVEGIIAKIQSEQLPKQVVLLTDLDPRGKKLYRTLCHDLNRHGITIDNELRDFLFRETKLRQIEGIVRYLEK